MDSNLTDQIVDIFEAKLGWTASCFAIQSDKYQENLDGLLQLKLDQDAIRLVYKIKKSVVPTSIGSIEHTIEDVNLKVLNAQGTILLANYISTKAREILYQNNINYADTGGNIFLKYKGIHIFIETGQSDRSALTNEAGRAFTKTGLKVVHQFFRTNQVVSINDTYRKIAVEAEVSKDTVAKVITDLLAKDYLLRQSKTEFKWRAKKELFKKWVQSYNQTLRPTLLHQRFKFVAEPESLQNSPNGYQIGGYAALDWHFPIPKDKQISNPQLVYYTHKPIREAVKDLNLIPTPDGRVSIYQAFWTDESDSFVAVDNIISYADLLSTNDPRYLDIAQLIYQNNIHDQL